MSSSWASSRIAAALFERTVQIWDIEAGKRIAEFDTVLSFGGRRLAMDASGELCFAAGWNRGKKGGVACYEATSGKKLWHRTDLGQTQHVAFSIPDESLWRVPESGPTLRLDARTGDTLEEIQGLASIYIGPSGHVRVLERRKRDYIVKSGKEFTIPRFTPALLDVAIAPDSVCVCESVGFARCFDLLSGTERWRCDPGKGTHVLRVYYRAVDGAFYGSVWGFDNGFPRTLVRFGEQSGEPREVCDLNSSWAEIFSPAMDCVVTSAGSVLALSDGTLLNCLRFPERDYPE